MPARPGSRLVLAAHLIATREIAAVTVVTPTDHLKRQWADAAHAAGIRLDPGFRNAAGATGREYDGTVVTYAQVAAAPLLHRARTEARRTLVVLDEVHHAGDALSWGDGDPRGLHAGRPSARPDRYAVPRPTTTRSRSSPTPRTAPARCARSPTRPTGTARRCGTRWCGR